MPVKYNQELQAARDLVGLMFGELDGLRVSKPRLVIAVYDIWVALRDAKIELFFLNPQHPMFEKISDEQRDILTKLVAERKS